jgi:predicted GIY-YIG superfamily endonuclease
MGYLYIISNKAWPGYVKIGVTENLNKRLQQYQTASPYRDYVLEYSLYHPRYLDAEKKIKEVMKHFALEIRNEWFRIDIKFAISRLQEQIDAFQNGEYL